MKQEKLKIGLLWLKIEVENPGIKTIIILIIVLLFAIGVLGALFK